MAVSGQPQQTSPSPAQAKKEITGARVNQEKRSLADAMASTKYDILPPLFKIDHPPIQPASSSMTQAHRLFATPTIPSELLPAVRYSAECLAATRIKLAAQKVATAASASGQSEDANKQVFEVTKVKTIKCDICMLKNNDLLYKCKNCLFHHQICSRCVENHDPQASAGKLGKKDWSVHAKLKEAHASYKLPVCLDRMDDGSYEKDGVRLFIAQKRRNGNKDKKSKSKTGVKPSERKVRVYRTRGGSETTEQGRRIVEAAKAKLGRSMSAELGGRVEAARAMMNREEDGAEAQGTKRKLDVLVEDEDEDENEDEDEDKDEDEDEDEDGDGDEAPAAKKARAENTGE